ncbi:hypothetical protein E2320_007268 [Naja naja]|nr:hypothetical protein E2320_007268 [Naja naja]
MKPVFSSLPSERARVDAERKALETLRAFYSELKSQLENCPESMREQVKDQMQREAEALETETKLFEDLEFQQLEKESRWEEQHEMLHSEAQGRHRLARREDRVAALEGQAKQLRLQAAQEADRLHQERRATLQRLQQHHLPQGLQQAPRGSRGLGAPEENVPKEPRLCPSDPQWGLGHSLERLPWASRGVLEVGHRRRTWQHLPSHILPHQAHSRKRERETGFELQRLPQILLGLHADPVEASGATLPLPGGALFQCSPSLSFPLFSVVPTVLPFALVNGVRLAFLVWTPGLGQLLLDLCPRAVWPAALPKLSSGLGLLGQDGQEVQQPSWPQSRGPSLWPQTLPQGYLTFLGQSSHCVSTPRAFLPQGSPPPVGRRGSPPRKLTSPLLDLGRKREAPLHHKGHRAVQEQWQRLADPKQKAAVECQALRGRALFSPLVPPPGLHHHPFPGQGQLADDPEPAYDTLSLESSDSLETNLSLSGNSACSPDNASSASGADARKIEEMEKRLREAQAERLHLMESRVSAGATASGWGSLEPVPTSWPLQASWGGGSRRVVPFSLMNSAPIPFPKWQGCPGGGTEGVGSF